MGDIKATVLSLLQTQKLKFILGIIITKSKNKSKNWIGIITKKDNNTNKKIRPTEITWTPIDMIDVIGV